MSDQCSCSTHIRKYDGHVECGFANLDLPLNHYNLQRQMVYIRDNESYAADIIGNLMCSPPLLDLPFTLNTKSMKIVLHKLCSATFDRLDAMVQPRFRIRFKKESNLITLERASDNYRQEIKTTSNLMAGKLKLIHSLSPTIQQTLLPSKNDIVNFSPVNELQYINTCTVSCIFYSSLFSF